MTITITREEATVTAWSAAGRVARTFSCRSVANAVELEAKLTSDKRFAAEWAYQDDPKPPKHNDNER
ncbi:MAG: hypothetical protein WCJ64_12595 [Rhodospirillaceae bacterium]